jgi:hypothetical protein
MRAGYLWKTRRPGLALLGGILLALAMPARAGANDPREVDGCLDHLARALRAEPALTESFAVKGGAVQSRPILAFVAKPGQAGPGNGKARPDLPQVLRWADTQLSAPVCQAGPRELYVVFPGEASYAIKVSELAKLRDIRARRELWEASVAMRLSRVNAPAR